MRLLAGLQAVRVRVEHGVASHRCVRAWRIGASQRLVDAEPGVWRRSRRWGCRCRGRARQERAADDTLWFQAGSNGTQARWANDPCCAAVTAGVGRVSHCHRPPWPATRCADLHLRTSHLAPFSRFLLSCNPGPFIPHIVTPHVCHLRDLFACMRCRIRRVGERGARPE